MYLSTKTTGPFLFKKKREHDIFIKNHIFIRPYKKMDINMLYSELDKTDWNKLKNPNIDQYWDNLKNKLIEICMSFEKNQNQKKSSKLVWK